MVEVVKSYDMVRNFNNFKSFSYVCGEKIGSIADIGRKILNMLILVRKNFFAYISPEIFYNLVKILGKVGQNMTTPPPPPQC
jgi:hypothetical protein